MVDSSDCSSPAPSECSSDERDRTSQSNSRRGSEKRAAKVPVASVKTPAKQPAKRGRKKRPKDMPRRPLSAYNLYFRRERQNIINSKPPEIIIAEAEELRTPDEKAKKRINLFQALAVLISKEWKILKSDHRRGFEEMAKEEMKEYRKKLGEYQIRLAQKSIKGFDCDDDDRQNANESEPDRKLGADTKKASNHSGGTARRQGNSETSSGVSRQDTEGAPSRNSYDDLLGSTQQGMTSERMAEDRAMAGGLPEGGQTTNLSSSSAALQGNFQSQAGESGVSMYLPAVTDSSSLNDALFLRSYDLQRQPNSISMPYTSWQSAPGTLYPAINGSSNFASGSYSNSSHLGANGARSIQDLLAQQQQQSYTGSFLLNQMPRQSDEFRQSGHIRNDLYNALLQQKNDSLVQSSTSAPTSSSMMQISDSSASGLSNNNPGIAGASTIMRSSFAAPPADTRNAPVPSQADVMYFLRQQELSNSSNHGVSSGLGSLEDSNIALQIQQRQQQQQYWQHQQPPR